MLQIEYTGLIAVTAVDNTFYSLNFGQSVVTNQWKVMTINLTNYSGGFSNFSITPVITSQINRFRIVAFANIGNEFFSFSEKSLMIKDPCVSLINPIGNKPRGPVRFEWMKVSSYHRYRIVITGPVNFNVETSENISLPLLTPGSYQFQIQAFVFDDEDVIIT
jgi:hypothetical protein